MRRLPALAGAVLLLISGCTSGSAAEPSVPAVPIGSSAPTLAVERQLPHDTSRFTQGLVRVRDELVETTGLVGESTLIVMDLQGRTKRSVKLPAQVFGEGVAVDPALDGGTVWVLT